MIKVASVPPSEPASPTGTRRYRIMVFLRMPWIRHVGVRSWVLKDERVVSASASPWYGDQVLHEVKFTAIVSLT